MDISLHAADASAPHSHRHPCAVFKFQAQRFGRGGHERTDGGNRRRRGPARCRSVVDAARHTMSVRSPPPCTASTWCTWRAAAAGVLLRTPPFLLRTPPFLLRTPPRMYLYVLAAANYLSSISVHNNAVVIFFYDHQIILFCVSSLPANLDNFSDRHMLPNIDMVLYLFDPNN